MSVIASTGGGVVGGAGAAAGAAGVEFDRFDVRRVQFAPGRLRPFNDAGVLAAADVHVALRLGRFGGDEDDLVLLGAALAVRAPRLSHVCVDIGTVRRSVIIDAEIPVDARELPWPDADEWMARLTASPLVAVGVDGPGDRPLRLVGTLLYLDRYWREECQVAADLTGRSQLPAPGVDLEVLADGLARLFSGSAPDYQRLAAASAILRRFSVVAGGPGTGKTTTVARILALLHEQAAAAGAPSPLVALAAPTGKAAARLEEAIHSESASLDISEATRLGLLAAGASTLHRLLGWRPDSESRFRYDRGNRLPHDVVIVDETSMVSLSLMARLVEAVRSDARLVLVGDPEQLASVEAGAVLGDVVGPAAGGLVMRPAARDLLESAARQPVVASNPPAGTAIGDGIVLLRQVHRFAGGIAALAEAVRQGDADGALELLEGRPPDVQWIPFDIAEPGAGRVLSPVRAAIVAAGRRVTEAARAGEAKAAIEALDSFRLLCAHRMGAYGVATWMPRIESWLAAEIEDFAAEGTWYVGRPLLVTENDYGLRLFNGDTGVVVAGAGGQVKAAFERRGEVLEFSPTRLAAVDTVYAMTVHKSQGSQFSSVAVLLPDPASPILTRELMYTAITRARNHLILVGTEEAIRAAITHPIARSSGLRRALWNE
jgi:exodeoxyribonuclease V alpha subunit